MFDSRSGGRKWNIPQLSRSCQCRNESHRTEERGEVSPEEKCISCSTATPNWNLDFKRKESVCNSIITATCPVPSDVVYMLETGHQCPIRSNKTQDFVPRKRDHTTSMSTQYIHAIFTLSTLCDWTNGDCRIYFVNNILTCTWC